MTVPTFVCHLTSVTTAPTGVSARPIRITMLWTVTFGGETFVGTLAEFFEFVDTCWSDVEFVETCEAGVLTFTPTGRTVTELFRVSTECGLFLEEI